MLNVFEDTGLVSTGIIGGSVQNANILINIGSVMVRRVGASIRLCRQVALQSGAQELTSLGLNLLPVPFGCTVPCRMARVSLWEPSPLGIKEFSINIELGVEGTLHFNINLVVVMQFHGHQFPLLTNTEIFSNILLALGIYDLCSHYCSFLSCGYMWFIVENENIK